MMRPHLMLTPGAWLAYMVGYGLVALLRWMVVTAFRVARWLFWHLVALVEAYRRRQIRLEDDDHVVVPFRHR